VVSFEIKYVPHQRPEKTTAGCKGHGAADADLENYKNISLGSDWASTHKCRPKSFDGFDQMNRSSPEGPDRPWTHFIGAHADQRA
jgi:hypothetical protein